MNVDEIMVESVVTCPASTALDRVVERMLAERIGSVVLTNEGTPSSIVTETDVLLAGFKTDRCFSEIPVKPVASSPLITVSPDTTVRMAVDRMREEGIKKLPVREDLDLVGIVTKSDIVAAQPDMLDEALHNEERQAAWESRRMEF